MTRSLKFAWTMLFASLIYGSGATPIWGSEQSLDRVEMLRQMAAVTAPTLNDVSKDWSYASLQQHLAVELDKQNRVDTEAMLQRASVLGKFKQCDDLKQGTPKGIKIPGAVALVGRCKFENGVGNVQILYVPVDGKLKIATLIVRP